MSSATATQEHPRTIDRKREFTAWGILWLALSAFCLLCAASGVGVYYFLFNSTVLLQSQVMTSRGTLGVTGTDLLELVVRDQPRYLLLGDSVTINPDSQGLVLIEDVALDVPFIASITLRADAGLTVMHAARPRFDWSTRAYEITFGDVRGDLEITVSNQIERPIRIILQASAGQMFLTAPGRYQISARSDQIVLSNISGDAVLVSGDRTDSRAVPVGARALLETANPGIHLQAGYVNLLGESTFRDVSIIDPNMPVVPNLDRTVTGWICSNPPSSQPPRGSYALETVDGRLALQIVRGDNATTHGETRCTKRFGPGATGIDISGYSYLAVRATFRITGQSLAVCGVAGSECPLMLEMQYLPEGVDAASVPPRDPTSYGPLIDQLTPNPARKWNQGFYSIPAGQFQAPLRCATCPQEHASVRPGRWYSYDSGNLIQLFPPQQGPRYILNLSFYASGHQYEVDVSEVELVVGSIDTPLAEEES